MSDSADNALLPCPFCGGKAASFEDSNHSTAWEIGCYNGQCAAEPHVWEETKEKAISAWNRRADLPSTDAQVMDHPKVRALRDIAEERIRQVSVEGWVPEHDDTHSDGEMARAAAAYAAASTYYHADPYQAVLSIWPWSREWLKPTNPRRDLVKAGALILAEIERLDRAAFDTGDKTDG